MELLHFVLYLLHLRNLRFESRCGGRPLSVAVELAGALTKFRSGSSRQFGLDLFLVELLSEDPLAVPPYFGDLGPLLCWISDGNCQAVFLSLHRQCGVAFLCYEIVSSRWVCKGWTQIDSARWSHKRALDICFAVLDFVNLSQLGISTPCVLPPPSPEDLEGRSFFRSIVGLSVSVEFCVRSDRLSHTCISMLILAHPYTSSSHNSVKTHAFASLSPKRTFEVFSMFFQANFSQ